MYAMDYKLHKVNIFLITVLAYNSLIALFSSGSIIACLSYMFIRVQNIRVLNKLCILHSGGIIMSRNTHVYSFSRLCTNDQVKKSLFEKFW